MSDTSNRTPGSISNIIVAIGKLLLALATLLFLSSMGGGMAFGAPVLVPLHWFAARTSGRWMRGVWIFLASVSVVEAVWIYAYLAFGIETWLIPLIGVLITVVIFVRSTTPTPN